MNLLSITEICRVQLYFANQLIAEVADCTACLRLTEQLDWKSKLYTELTGYKMNFFVTGCLRLTEHLDCKSKLYTELTGYKNELFKV